MLFIHVPMVGEVCRKSADGRSRKNFGANKNEKEKKCLWEPLKDMQFQCCLLTEFLSRLLTRLYDSFEMNKEVYF